MTMVPFRVRHIKTRELGTVTGVTHARSGSGVAYYTWYDIHFDNGVKALNIESYMVTKIYDSIKLTSEMTEIPLLAKIYK